MKLTQPAWLTIILFVFAILLYLLNDVLFPFVMSMTLAYMGDPLVDRLEDKGWNRTAGVSACFAVMTIIIVALFIWVLPMMAAQFRFLAELGPVALERFQTEFIPWLEARSGINLQTIQWAAIGQQVDWKATGGLVSGLLANLTASGLMILTLLGNLALIPVVTFYLLRDWDYMLARIRGLIPVNHEAKVVILANECHEVLKAFVRGQLLVMLALAIIYSTGLMLVGLKLGLLVGLLAGLASIVPYMGFVVGFGAALIAGLLQFDAISPILLIGLVFVLGQLIEGMFLTPTLVGDRIGLHPVAVIFALMVGGNLFGFIGILIALPVAAVIMVLLRHIHSGYKISHLYQPDSNIPTDPP